MQRLKRHDTITHDCLTIGDRVPIGGSSMIIKNKSKRKYKDGEICEVHIRSQQDGTFRLRTKEVSRLYEPGLVIEPPRSIARISR